MTSAQAQATKDQVWQKAAATDYTQKLDMSREVVAYCPECGTKMKA